MIKKIFVLILFTSVLFFQSGCSAIMAAHQPTRKNTNLFQIGTPRNQLLAEFGNPTAVDERNGTKYEIFRFKQGYSGPAKLGEHSFMLRPIFLLYFYGKS